MQFSLDKTLKALGIDALNEMQLASREKNREHENVLLLSRTGSGKTLAYLLPLLDHIDVDKQGTQAMIIVPSRELALQIDQVLRSMSTGLKITCCYGGHLRETEENNLVESPAIIVGTPGRIADHLRRGNIKPAGIHTLVLDEFDKSVEQGFEEEMSFIIQSLPAVKKRILTSATDAPEIPSFVGFENPEVLNFLSDDDVPAIHYRTVHSADPDKLETLFKLICACGARSIIVFCNHRDAVERVSEYLKSRAIVNVFYHGALEQPERDSALAKFRNGTSDVLITTDLASRGLDIPNIRFIIHYHLPLTEEAFTHRNGRTARMDASGVVILLLGPEEEVPEYVSAGLEEMRVPDDPEIPEKPKWSTLFIAAGKKDKVNKVDVVGFLGNKGQLKKEDIGLIEVKDFFAFVAVRKSKMNQLLMDIKNEKIKGKKVKMDIAK